MIIVAGYLIIKKNKRDEFLERSKIAVIAGRKNHKCFDFNVTADLIENDRVCIFERWKDHSSLNAFRGTGPSEDLSSLILDAKVIEYTVEV